MTLQVCWLWRYEFVRVSPGSKLDAISFVTSDSVLRLIRESHILTICLRVHGGTPADIVLNRRFSISDPSILDLAPEIFERFHHLSHKQGKDDDEDRERDGGDPEDPLWELCIADIDGVHAEEGGDEGKWEEDDGDEGEDEDGGFLAVFSGFDAEEVLSMGRWLEELLKA